METHEPRNPESRGLEAQLNRYLGKLSGGILQTTKVFELPPDKSPKHAVGQLSIAASTAYLYGVLMERDVTHVGVGWGRSVEQPIIKLGDYIKTCHLPMRTGDSRIWVVPTCGRTLGIENRPELFCSMLAASLERAVNEPPEGNGKPRCKYLYGVPNFIHDALLDSTVADVRKRQIRTATGWREIFDGESAMVHKLDAIVTSLGPLQLSEEGRGWVDDICRYGGLDPQILMNLAAYDIGGIFVAKAELESSKVPECGSLSVETRTEVDYDRIIQADYEYDSQYDRDVARWNQRLTCIRRTHYKSCARRAASQCKPGVIVFAIGAVKSSALIHAIKSGLVNTIVIDNELADAMVKTLANHAR